MPLFYQKSVTYVSERVLPFCPVYTVSEGVAAPKAMTG
jgi:hypothetical protein